MERKIIHITETDSTNSYLARLLQNGEEIEHGTTVYTDYQSAGRGQKNNKWESEKGKNLLFSIMLHPQKIKAHEQFSLSEAASLGVVEFLKTQADGFSVKWPNDIYWKDKKIAGMLIENSLREDCIESCIAGIGLNLNQEKFYSNAPNPISLNSITGKIYKPAEILETVRNNILRLFDKAERCPENLHEEYKNSLWRNGEQHKYKDSEGLFEGTIEDVEPAGRLLIRKSDGRLFSYAFKEVEFVLTT